MLKLCPICDSKIGGTWCKSCHRFVKPIEIKSNIYLNEPHNKYNDKGCEYHNPSQGSAFNSGEVKQRIRERMASGSSAASVTLGDNTSKGPSGGYSGRRTVQERPGQTGSADNQPRNKKNNIIRIIIIIYFVYIFLSVIFELLAAFLG